MILFLCPFSLLAGFIDSVVGGGGLIQIPAMLILLPGMPIATILGTNKFASCAGTTIAVRRYSQHVTYDWPTIMPAAIAAFIFSFLGSRTVALLNTAYLRPIDEEDIDRDQNEEDEDGLLRPVFRLMDESQIFAQWLGILIGAALGFYEWFLRSGHGELPDLSIRGRFRFRFSVGLGLRQSHQSRDQYRVGPLLRVDGPHHLRLRHSDGPLQRSRRRDRNAASHREG